MIDKLLNRRSHRSFKEEKIDSKDLNLIKKATLQAPTAGNLSLYSIIEIEDENIKEKLSILCDNQPMIKKAPHVWVFLADFHRWIEYFKYSKSDIKTGIEIRDLGLGDLHLALQDTIIASQTATVAIDDLGYGSCYVGDIIENFEEVQKLLNLPQYAVPATMLIFGKPKKQLKTPLVRPNIDTIFFKDIYKNQSNEELVETYSKHEKRAKENNTLPFENTGTIADQFYIKKFSSDFMKEMNRSTKVFIEKWCEKNTNL
ncbi:MAG: nitroreductase family protein [Pleomorphochaeta sp.]